MRALALLLGLLSVAALPGPARAGELHSHFGFTATVPESWMILSREQLEENRDAFEDAAALPGFEGFDPAVLRDFESRVRGGQIELMFRKQGSAIGFADNLNVLQLPGAVPPSAQVDAYCAMLPGELTRSFGRTISIHHCRAADGLAGRSMYVEFDGVLERTLTMQYQIQMPGNRVIVITATASIATAGQVRPDLNSIVTSIRFD